MLACFGDNYFSAGYPVTGKIIGRISGKIIIRYSPNKYINYPGSTTLKKRLSCFLSFYSVVEVYVGRDPCGTEVSGGVRF